VTGSINLGLLGILRKISSSVNKIKSLRQQLPGILQG